jgi:PAS domain S-box-containing protein
LKASKAHFVAGRHRSGEDRAERVFQLGVLFALIVVPLLMLTAGLQLGQELRRGRELREAVNRSYERRAEAQEVFSLIQAAETGQRGYVLTQDPRFLQPYNAAVAQLETRAAGLRQAVAGDPDQERRAARLGQLSREKLREMARVLETLERSGSGAARARVAEGVGRELMDEIRAVTTEFVDLEAEGLERRIEEERRRSVRTERSVVLLFVLLGAVVTGAGFLFLRHVQGRRALLTQVEEVAVRQQAVLDSAIDAIITLNPSGTIETVNAAGEQMFGYDESALARRDLSTVLEMDTARAEPFLARLIGPGETLQAGVAKEMTGRRRDGRTFPADVALGEMRLPDGPRVVAIVRDISERQRVSQLKEEFVSTVSHELRTPLTSIAGSLGLVSGGAAGDVPAPARRLVDIALTNCQRLVRLINDVLDIEKMESGQARFDLRPAPLGEIAARSVEDTRGFAEGLGVRLRLETDGSAPMIRADADRIVQVSINLLSNAAKFSPPGETVVVRVATVDDKARLSVRDRGPGVPEDFRDRIFSKFAQADGSDTRQKGGTGLGLVIAREIVERHGGRLWYENMPDGGAAFHAEFAKIGEHAAVLEPGVRLLVCEDEVVTAAALREVLEDEGFIVDVAETLADAEQALRRADYACLVTDLKLPDGSGLGLVERLRAEPRRAADPDHRRVRRRRAPAHPARGGAPGHRRLDEQAGGCGAPEGRDPGGSRRLRYATVHPARRRRCRHAPDHGRGPVGLRRGDQRRQPGRGPSCTEARRPDLVVLDIGLADGSGLQLLPELENAPEGRIPVVVFTAQSGDENLSNRVDAVLTKSRTSLSALARTVRRLVSVTAAERVREEA